jgi:hypothetical protein
MHVRDKEIVDKFYLYCEGHRKLQRKTNNSRTSVQTAEAKIVLTLR